MYPAGKIKTVPISTCGGYRFLFSGSADEMVQIHHIARTTESFRSSSSSGSSSSAGGGIVSLRCLHGARGSGIVRVACLQETPLAFAQVRKVESAWCSACDVSLEGGGQIIGVLK